MKLLNEENHILHEQIRELSEKCQTLQKNYELKKDESDNSVSRFSEINKRNKTLEIDLEEIRKIRDVLEVKYKNASEDLNRLELEREEYINQVKKLENEVKIAKSQLQNSKKSFSELEDKKQMELEILSKELDSFRIKEREYTNKIIFAERELDTIKDENRRLKKELENTKGDCDQMLKMMENLEAKVVHFQRKEDTVNRLQKESKERVEEALLQRDRALLKEEQYQRTIDTMNETHRQEIQTLKDQYDRMMENLRTKHRITLEQRDTEIRALSEDHSKLQVQHDKAQKELKTLRNDFNRLNNVVKESNSKEEARVAELERKNQELEEKILKSEHEAGERIRNLVRDNETLDSANKELNTALNDIKTSTEGLRSQVTTLGAENTNMKSKLANIQRERQNFLEEIDKIKKNYETQISIYAEDYSAKMREMEDQVQESINKEKTTREKTLELLRTHEQVFISCLYWAFRSKTDWRRSLNTTLDTMRRLWLIWRTRINIYPKGKKSIKGLIE